MHIMVNKEEPTLEKDLNPSIYIHPLKAIDISFRYAGLAGTQGFPTSFGKVLESLYPQEKNSKIYKQYLAKTQKEGYSGIKLVKPKNEGIASYLQYLLPNFHWMNTYRLISAINAGTHPGDTKKIISYFIKTFPLTLQEQPVDPYTLSIIESSILLYWLNMFTDYPAYVECCSIILKRLEKFWFSRPVLAFIVRNIERIPIPLKHHAMKILSDGVWGHDIYGSFPLPMYSKSDTSLIDKMISQFKYVRADHQIYCDRIITTVCVVNNTTEFAECAGKMEEYNLLKQYFPRKQLLRKDINARRFAMDWRNFWCDDETQLFLCAWAKEQIENLLSSKNTVSSPELRKYFLLVEHMYLPSSESPIPAYQNLYTKGDILSYITVLGSLISMSAYNAPLFKTFLDFIINTTKETKIILLLHRICRVLSPQYSEWSSQNLQEFQEKYKSRILGKTTTDFSEDDINLNIVLIQLYMENTIEDAFYVVLKEQFKLKQHFPKIREIILKYLNARYPETASAFINFN